MIHVRKLWDKFQDDAMPKDASLVQLVEMRRAFYAGAALLFQEMMGRAEDPYVTDEEGSKFVAEVELEIEQYVQDLETNRV